MYVVSPLCTWDHLVNAGAKPRAARPPACRGGLARSAHSSTSRQHPPTQDPTGQGKRNNWLQVFKRAHTAVLGSGGGPEQRTSLVPSEKCVGGWGRDDGEMRMITASFVRAFARLVGHPCLHFLPLFQHVVAI